MLANYHTRSIVVYLLVWFLLALFYNKMVQLALMLLIVFILNYWLDRLSSFKKICAFVVPLALLIIVINTLFNQNGEVLLTAIPLPGYTIAIYQEAMIFGLAMAVKLALILAIFTIFNRLIPVEKVMGIFGRFGGPAVLMLAISARLIPDLALRARAIAQVQRSRGAGIQEGSLIARICQLGPLLYNLLRASLRTAWQMAETMQARGYSSGYRSVYSKEQWKLQDWLLSLLTLTALGMALYIGAGVQNSSPLQQASLPLGWMEIMPLLLLLLPLFIGFVWRKA